MNNGPQFHQTGYGRKFFESQLPKLIDNIGKVAYELERANNLKEMEMQQNHATKEKEAFF